MTSKKGTIVKFDSGRRFGFIRPAGGRSDDIFFHASAVSKGEIALGSTATFDTEMGEKGPKAVNVRIAAPPVSPYRFFIGAVVFITAVSFAALELLNAGLDPLYEFLIAINVAAFVACGFDKQAAQGSALRVPEAVLFGVAAIGGSVGLALGMSRFRHKTQSARFQFIVFVIMAVQVVLVLQAAGALR